MNSFDESEAVLPKTRPPSASESTSSAHEKMDIYDNSSREEPSKLMPVVTSHLREMLESAPKRKTSPNGNLPSASPSVSPSTCATSEVYKFKKDIKDRFQADQKTVQEPVKPISPTNVHVDDEHCERGSNSSLSSLVTQSSDQRSETSGYSSISSSSNKTIVVPIFALHPSGHYYLPLTLDANIISPYISKEADANPFPILHPINITVNFNYQQPQQQQPLINFPPPTNWHQMMPTLIAPNFNFSSPPMPTFNINPIDMKISHQDHNKCNQRSNAVRIHPKY